MPDFLYNGGQYNFLNDQKTPGRKTPYTTIFQINK